MGSCKQREMTAEQQGENQKRQFMGQPAIHADETLCLAGSNDPSAEVGETPQHRISLRGFQLGMTKVTLRQFKKYVVAVGRYELVNKSFMEDNKNGDNAPVVDVSWLDAQDFIKWLNETEGGGYRLPSESEWEYACRAGGTHTYCGSNKIEDVAWYEGSSNGHAHIVASKKPNAFGLFDMSGNAWEWVQDCWHLSYKDAPDDGSAWIDSCVADARMQRSNSWHNPSKLARSANRGWGIPHHRLGGVGFRLARTI